MPRHRFCVLLAISLASRSASSAAQHAGHSHTARQAPIPGKVPITSRSPAAIALYLEGRTLQEALKPHEAHARYGRALALDRGFALAAYGLAATAPSPRAAREHLRQALVLGDSVSAGERLVIHVLEARLDRGPAAWAAVAESLVALHPDDERAHWMLGSARSALGEYAAALAAYRGAIGINPDFALAYNSIGYAERNAGHPAAAEAAFRRYIALVPDDPNPYDSYGELLLTLGRFDEAIAQYRRAQAIDPAFAGSFVGIASAEALAGRHEAGRAEARRYLAAARDAHEQRAALQTLALVEADDGRPDDALAALARMHDVAASDGDTASMVEDVMDRGELLLDLGRVADAERAIRDADLLAAAASIPVEQQVEVIARTDFLLARVAIAAGDLDRAATAAANLAGGDERWQRRAHELRGRVALAAGEVARAVVELEAADRSDPSVLVLLARAHQGNGQAAMARQIGATVSATHRLLNWPLVRARIALREVAW